MSALLLEALDSVSPLSTEEAVLAASSSVGLSPWADMAMVSRDLEDSVGVLVVMR